MMNRQLLLCITLITSCIARAEIAVPDIKGMYNDIIDGKKHLSPVHGLNWYKTGIIENMYRFGDEKQASIKLIKEMFHLEPDGVTFNITGIQENPAFYFTSKTIGKILNYIENNVDINKEHLRRIIAEDIGYVGDTIAELNKTLESNRRQQERSQKKSKESNAQEAKLQEAKISIENKINKLKQTSLCPKVESKQFNKFMNCFLECCNGIKDSKDNFYVLHNILLSFMWKKADSKQEFFDYCAQFTPGILASSVNADLWLASAYSQNDYEEFKESLEKKAIAALQDYELSSFGSCMAQEWGEIYPPIIGGGMATYIAKNGNRYSFSDCGETSLRNFFDIVLYNTEIKKFDISYLQNKDGISLSKALESYYINHNDAAKISTQPYYNAWAQVVSGLPNVAYRTDGVCNITGNDTTPRLNNALKIFNHLLFGNSAAFDALSTEEKLNYLTKSVSRDGFILTWSLESGALDKNVATRLKFEVKTTDSNYSFNWLFDVGHFVIPPIGSKSSAIQSLIAYQLINAEVPQFYLLGWYTFGWYKNADLLKDIKDTQRLNLAIYMQNLANSEEAIEVVLFLLDKKIIDESLIIKLCKSLPGDTYVFRKIIDALPKNSEYKDFIDEFVTKLMIDKPILALMVSQYDFNGYITKEHIGKIDQSSLGNLMVAIIKGEVDRFYEYITPENVGKLGPDFLGDLMIAIIEFRIDRFYEYITPENVGKIGPGPLGRLMVAIITNQLDRFYEYITPENVGKIDSFFLDKLVVAIIYGKVDRFYGYITQGSIDRLIIDRYYSTNILNMILQKEIEQLYKEITQERINKLDQNEISYLMELILKNKIEQLYKYVIPENISRMYPERKIKVLKDILENKIEQLYDRVTSESISSLPSYYHSGIVDMIIKNGDQRIIENLSPELLQKIKEKREKMRGVISRIFGF